MRDNTLSSTDLRWEILKSMLDDFPQLQDRAERYLLQKKNSTQDSSNNSIDSSIKELIQEAANKYRQEHSRK